MPLPYAVSPSRMHFPSQEQKQALLEKVMRIADQRLKAADAKQARAFIGHYYDQVDAEDLADRAAEDLYGAAMAHLSLARRFSSGTPRLRVYNPRADEHGWTSPYTVIEIVNDDMPFLVDSVTMEVNRQGYTVHLLNHPIFGTRRDKEGQLGSFSSSGKEGQAESLIHVEVDREVVYGRGGAVVVEPTWGEVIAGPLYDAEGTLYADCDLRAGLHAKRWFDAVGHYGRTDVLSPTR